MPLSEVFWNRVIQVLATQGRDEAYLRETVPRDKNTYTNWFRRRQLKKIKDLEDIAEALGVPASVLISHDGGTSRSVDQLRLHFEPDSKHTSIILDCDDDGIIVRPG